MRRAKRNLRARRYLETADCQHVAESSTIVDGWTATGRTFELRFKADGHRVDHQI